jgi:hydroxymethylglutaryl-CoA reductase (NADPH)
MDLRNLPPDLTSPQRVDARRAIIERELGADLSALSIAEAKLGHAEEKNCENMFGAVPIPVGLAGPLTITLSDGTKTTVYLPLATTEGALVASVNRGCKALSACDVRTSSIYHGVTRSLAFRTSNPQPATRNWIQEHEAEWKSIGEATSSHLKILSYDIDEKDDHLFLTIAADTDEAMGMNMVTIAAQAIGDWIEAHCPAAPRDGCGCRLVTVAGNVDSDKKPSQRTHDRGRGYEATASCTLQSATITEILKTTPEALLVAAHAKLDLGSSLAGAIGSNCHAANIIAALYLATGQDAAHVVEGSLTDTTVERAQGRKGERAKDLVVTVRLPALLLGIRGGGTTLPAQKECLGILLHSTPNALRPTQYFAELFAAAVLAGEISLLAAQASNTLASAHARLGRKT